MTLFFLNDLEDPGLQVSLAPKSGFTQDEG